jgi:hypothetical protein
VTAVDVLPYRERTRALAAVTEAAVLAAHAAHESGDLTDEQLHDTVAGIVAGANSRAASLADLALAAALTAATRRPVAPVGITLPDPRARLRVAVATITVGPVDQVTYRLALLGRAEPLEAGHQATTTAMRTRRDRVEGWTRAAGPGACPMCRNLADGTVLSPETPMRTHKGCSCVQQPVIR